MKQDYLSCWTDKNCFKNEEKETICMYEYYRNIVFRNECICSLEKYFYHWNKFPTTDKEVCKTKVKLKI